MGAPQSVLKGPTPSKTKKTNRATLGSLNKRVQQAASRQRRWPTRGLQKKAANRRAFFGQHRMGFGLELPGGQGGGGGLFVEGILEGVVLEGEPFGQI